MSTNLLKLGHSWQEPGLTREQPTILYPAGQVGQGRCVAQQSSLKIKFDFTPWGGWGVVARAPVAVPAHIIAPLLGALRHLVSVRRNVRLTVHLAGVLVVGAVHDPMLPVAGRVARALGGGQDRPREQQNPTHQTELVHAFIRRHSFTPDPEPTGLKVRAGEALAAQGEGVAEAAVERARDQEKQIKS